jgi:hypothetical protein
MKKKKDTFLLREADKELIVLEACLNSGFAHLVRS